MCGWNPIRNILESAASVVGNYLLPGSSLLTDNLVSKGAQSELSSPLGELANIGSGLAGGGAFGAGLQSAGGAAEQAGLSSLYNAGSNAITGLGNATGLSGIGSDIGNAASTAWNNFSDASGLNSFLGGTPETGSGLSGDYNAFTNTPGSADVAGAATTPGAQPLVGTTVSAPSVAAGGGGNLGGFGGSTVGNDLSGGLSSTGVGGTGGTLGNVGSNDFSAFNTAAPSGNLDIGSPSFTQNSGSILNGSANPLAPGANSAIGNGLSSQFSAGGLTANPIGSAAQSLDMPTGADFSGANPVSGASLGGGTQPQGGFLSNLLSGQSVQPNSFNYDINGAPAGNSAASIGSQFQSGGGNMGVLGSLFGGGTTGAAPASAGGNILNSVLKGGLGYLLNKPGSNDSLANAAQSAEQNFSPYLQAGNQAESTLSNLYGNNGQAAQASAQQGFANTSGYQFALNQGINAVDANAAAMGSPLSGNNQQAVNNYAQGTANQTYNNYVNQLQNMASGGMSAAGGIGTAQLAAGAGGEQVGQNNANAANTAIGTGLQGLFPSGGLNLAALLNGQGGGGNQGGLLSLFGGQ